MNDKKIKLPLEFIFLIILFGALIYIGPANILDKRISHDYPYAFMASDNFIHYLTTDNVKEQGYAKYFSPWYVGGYKDVHLCLPPNNYIFASLFSFMGGIESYDSIYLLTMLFSILNVFLVYIIIRKFNKNIAILSMPVSLLLFTNVFISGFTWAQWQSAVAYLFFTSSFWALTVIKERYMFIPLALFVSGIFMTHYPEFIIFGILGAIWVGYRVLQKKLGKEEIKAYIFGGIIFFIISLDEIIKFYGMWLGRGETLSKTSEISWATIGIPVPYLKDFGLWLLIPIIIGLVVSLFLIRKSNNKAIFLGVIMFILGFTNYLGFGKRTVTLRFMWPIYLAIFFGIFTYYAVGLITKKWKTGLSVVVGLLIIILIAFSYKVDMNFNGMVSPVFWDSIKWIRTNTPQDSKIFFFYVDGLSQSNMFGTTHRRTYIINLDDYIETLKNQSVKRYYKAGDIVEGCSRMIPHRTSLLNFKFYYDEDPNLQKQVPRDVCSFDYYIFQTGSSYAPALAQYNNYIKDLILKKEWIKETFSNGYFSIIHNEKPGDDCI